jgi:hypothetical protein
MRKEMKVDFFNYYFNISLMGNVKKLKVLIMPTFWTVEMKNKIIIDYTILFSYAFSSFKNK